MNGGVDEISAKQVAPKFPPVKTNPDGSLHYESVVANYDTAMDWLRWVWVGRAGPALCAAPATGQQGCPWKE